MLIQAAKRAVPLNLTILLVCILLVAYDAARSFTMSITHDEARTLAWHVTGQLGDILHFATPGLPDNNHLLFTLLAKGSVSLFGSGELALRLPSVLAYALYCVMMAHILARHLRGAMLLLYLLFAGLNPLLVDMLSIARGYGLGIALTTTGLYLLLRDCETSNRRPASWAAWASFSLALAVLAHLSFLLFSAQGL